MLTRRAAQVRHWPKDPGGLSGNGSLVALICVGIITLGSVASHT
jgi:hypothetical protein